MTDPAANPCPCPDPLAPCAAYGGIILGEYRWRVCRGEELTPEQGAAYRRKWAAGPRGDGTAGPAAAAVPYTPPPPRPVAAWPWAARRIASRRAPEDSGLGDTVHRLLGERAAVRLYQWFYKRLTGHECPTCVQRQAWLNQIFPYPDETQPPPERSTP